MGNHILINLVYNASLLLVMVAVYSGIRFKVPFGSALPSNKRDLLTGVLVGLMGIALMANPWVLRPGIFFDARGILLGVAGLFFGFIPTALAVAISGGYRLLAEGAGALPGLAVIVGCAGCGLAWRWLRPRLVVEGGLLKLYLFGVTLLLVQLAALLLLPWPLALEVLRKAALPLIIIFPLGAMLLSALLIHQRASRDTEEGLIESEARFRTLFEHSNDAIFLHGMRPDGRPDKFIEVNKVACERLGYSRDELLGLTPMDIDAGGMDAARAAALQKLAETGQTVFDMEHAAKDGRRVPVEISSRLFEYGGKRYGLSIARDITERKAAEAALKESKDLLEAIVENVPLTIFLKDAAELRFLLFNKAGEELVGHRRETMLNKNDQDLFPPEQAEYFLSQDREALAKDGVLDIPEEPIDTAKKGRRILHTRKVRIKGTDGTPKYLLGIAEDVTEINRASLEKRALEAQLLQAQKMETVGRLAGGVAHDFNNILTAIKYYCGVIVKSYAAGDPRLADAQEILAAADRAAALTRQLLTFSRRQIIMPKVLDLNKTITDMTKMLKGVIGEDVILDIRLFAAPCPVMADAGQMEQLVMNLAVNARDAMPGGGTITITSEIISPEAAFAANHPELKPGRLVKLTARDTGHGMTPEVRSHIFEPFFTTKPAGRGTGLGLSTIFGIIKQGGGEIEVESETGKGTAFFIYLPLAAPAEGQAEKPPDKPASLSGTETVLLVEDDRMLRRLGERLLRESGYTVLAAADGVDALQALERYGQPVDLLITDVVMPGMNGRELALEAARRGLAARTLYMSGYTDEAIAKHGVLEPGLAFIYKPFTAEGLALKLREVLEGPADRAKA
jgi:PAS domain S-box-containing protein